MSQTQIPGEPVVPELHEGLNAQREGKKKKKKFSSETFGQIRRITLNRD